METIIRAVPEIPWLEGVKEGSKWGGKQGKVQGLNEGARAEDP